MEGRNFTLTKERQNYLDISVLLFCLGFVWLASAIVGMSKLPNISILVFLTGASMIKPLVRICRKAFNIHHITSEKVNLVLSCLTIGMPLGLLVVFFPFVEDINIFYPAFSLITGVTFTVAAQGTDQKSFWFIGVSLMIGAVYSWLNLLEFFPSSGFISSALLLGFSIGTRILPEAKKSFVVEKATSTKPVTVR